MRHAGSGGHPATNSVEIGPSPGHHVLVGVTAEQVEDEASGGTAAYRAVLRIPGVAALVGVGFLARIPSAAAPITLTLHVVLTLQHGWAAAGLVGSASTVGMAIGAPLLGRLVDRRGLRPMLVLATMAETVFWGTAPFLSYPGLLVGALLGGALGLPVYSVIRQSLAALVPPRQRRPAFAIDSMSVELSYIIGPAVGSVLALQVTTPVAMWMVGAGWVASGVALMVLDPPTRTPEAPTTAPPPRVREWLDVRLFGALVATCAAVFVVFGTEMSMIAGLETSGQAAWIPVVNAVWCLASLSGGFVYGAVRRSPALPVLVAGLGAVSLPVALGGPWWSYALLLVPAGLLCAPSLAASAEAVSGLAPEHARGLVTGLHGSAITLGGAVATPLTGLLIDQHSPAVAVLAVGAVGIALAVVAGWAVRVRNGGGPSAGPARPAGGPRPDEGSPQIAGDGARPA